MSPSAIARLLSKEASSDLSEWIERNYYLLERTCAGAVAHVAHKERVKAEMYENLETTFIIPRSKLPNAQELARKLGVDVVPNDLDVATVQWQVEATLVNQQAKILDIPPSAVRLTEHQKLMVKAEAKRLVERFIQIRAVAPPAKERVVAIAKIDPAGAKHFYNLPYEQPYWSSDNSDINFHRCDICHQSRPRKQLFVLEDRSGSNRVVGGECAANLDLGRKLSGMLDAFKSFARDAEGFSDGEENYQRRVTSSAFPGDILLVATMVIRQRGYLSAKAAMQSTEERVTTSRVVLSFFDAPDKFPSTFLDEFRSRRAAGDGERLLERARPIVEDFIANARRSGRDFSFANSLKQGVETGSLENVGALAWLASALDTLEAKKRAPVSENPAWMPALVPAGDVSVQVYGPNFYEYSPDRRMRADITLSGQPLRGERLSERVSLSCSVEEIEPDLARFYRKMPAPEGKNLHIHLDIYNNALVNDAKSDNPGAVIELAIKAIRRGLYGFSDKLELVATPETLKEYERQEPGYAARIGCKKALDTGKMTKQALKDMARNVPGVWKCIEIKELPKNDWSTPRMYTFARDSDGRMLKAKSGQGLIMKAIPYELSERLKTFVNHVYLELGDNVYLSGTPEWPVPYRPDEVPLLGLSRIGWSFVDGELPDRVLMKNPRRRP